MIGKILGAYVVTAPLGKGAMGEVYEARHQVLGRRVAIKILQGSHDADSETVERFFNEARAASAVEDHGIVEVLDFGRDDDARPYLVMELLDGQSLGTRIREAGKLDVETALRITRQVATALRAVHARGIVHRDLKPDNVFLVRDPEVAGGERAKLVDFGIAKLADPDLRGGVATRTGTVMGTPMYMAPEQCRGSVEVDRRADLYALGCILYDMLCGTPPFVRAGLGDLLAAHMFEAHPPLRERGVLVPDGVAAIVDRLLEKDRERRYSSAAELLAALDDPDHAVAASPPRPSRDQAPDAFVATVLPGDVQAAAAPVPSTLSGTAVEVGGDLDVDLRPPRRGLLLAAIAVPVALVAVLWQSWSGGTEQKAAGVAAANVDAAPIATAPPVDAGPDRADIIALSRYGFFSVDADADTVIYIDGKLIGNTPISRLPLTPGEHTVRAEGPRKRKKNFTITIFASQDLEWGGSRGDRSARRRPRYPAPMPIRDYASHDGVGLAELVRRKQVTALELVDEALTRIARVDPVLHAVVARLDDQARAQARAGAAGVFGGVPFVLKDLLSSLTGTSMTSGSRLLRDHVCDHDSELVGRYRTAGLVFVARSRSPELGLAPVTEPEAYGPTGSPWDPERAAGGSSGGSAALVASGAVPMANGGDGGGSLRIPASCCGAFGFKPTRGRTPAGPDSGEHWHGLALEHAVTRSVRDSATLLDVSCAPDDGAPYAAPPRERPFAEEVGRAPGKLRIAWTVTPFLPSKVQPEAVAAVADAARLCAELGHEVVEAAPPIDPSSFARALIAVIASETAAEVAAQERALGRRRRAGELEVSTELVAMYGRAISGEQLCTAVRELRALGRVMAGFHRRHDVLLTPTMASPSPRHGALRSHGLQELAERAMARSRVDSLLRLPGVIDAMAARVYDFIPWTPLANATGAPSMSVPLYWTADGLPLGAMFTGRFGDDATLFRLAAQLEAARPWATRRPRVNAFD